MTVKHWPNQWDVENQIEPESAIIIRIPEREHVTSEQIANHHEGPFRGLMYALAGYAILGMIVGLAILFARAIK